MQTVKDSKPKYQLLADRFRKQIDSRELMPGDRLPSFAALRTHHGFTSVTIEHAYRILEQENLIERRGGSGVYVANDTPQQTRTIGLLLRSDGPDAKQLSPNIRLILDGIRAASRECDASITLLEKEDVKSDAPVDAILYHCDEFEAYALGMPTDFPQAILFHHASEITSIAIDDFNGSRTATSYLIENGHRRIACLMEEWMTIPIQRRMGYQVALREAGIEDNSAWMRLTPQKRPDQPHYYLEWGRDEMQKWLKSGWRELGCTAIIAQNDESAIGIIQALREANIHVPQDVSVIGFDGTSMCDLIHPKLTSMEIPFYEIGKEAIKVLLEQINNTPQAPRNISFPAKLREGETVASSITQGAQK